MMSFIAQLLRFASLRFASLRFAWRGVNARLKRRLGLEVLEERVLLSSDIMVLSKDTDTSGQVKVFDAVTQQHIFTLNPENGNFDGGIRVAAADVTGDGISDVLTGTGPGLNTVRVFDGTNGNLIRTITPFSNSESNGVFVAAADTDGDGTAEVVVGSESSGQGILRIFDANNGNQVYSATLGGDFTAGMRVAAGDVNADGKDDLILAAGPGKLPRVCVLDGDTKMEVYNFFAGDPTYRGGLYVASGDVDGDGSDDILTSAQQGSEVRVFRGSDTMQLSRFLAEASTFTGGVRVSTADVDGDGDTDIVTGSGPGEGKVRAFDIAGQTVESAFSPFGNGFDKGLFVAADAPGEGSIGVFSVKPTATIVPSVDVVMEGRDETGGFIVYLSAEQDEDFYVYVSVAGSATSGSDYSGVGAYAFFAQGQTTSHLFFTVTDDDVQEGPEKLIVNITANSTYDIGTPGSGTILFLDNDGPFSGVSDCNCGCAVDTVMKVAPEVAPVTPTKSAGVRAADGVMRVASKDLSSSGLGGWFSERSWANDPGMQVSGKQGNRVVMGSLPMLSKDSDGTIVLTACAGSAYYFDDIGGGAFETRHGGKEILTYDSGTGRYLIKDTTGGKLVFFDFDSSVPVAKRGTLEAYTDQGGNETEVVAWNSAGFPQEVQSSSTIGSTTVTESYLSTFITSGDNAGNVESVTLRRQTNGGSWTTVRSVEYAYYGSSESYGNLGDLKLVVLKDGSSNTIDTEYNRYYTGESGGYEGGLKYRFGRESYGRLVAAYSDPSSASDSQVDEFADLYAEYDTDSLRITTLVQQGEGCSVCTGGLGTYEFDYAISGFADGYNSWSTKQVATLPDGNTQTSYVNFAGQSILEVFKNTTTSQEWLSFSKYDNDGRLVLLAHPSAVSGYDESKPDLLNNQSGDYQYLRNSEGLFETFTYGTSTTATSTTAGDVAGYPKQTAIQRGETGTNIPQSLTEYISRTANSQTIYVTAAQTQYRNTNGTGAQTTTMAYTWRSGTLEAEQVTTTLPTVTTAQNGPNSATSDTVALDGYGRPIWTKDADGFLSYTEYDQATGGVIKTITDVDTTQTSTFSNLPSGWSTPSGGGLHLTSTMEVDSQGRTTKYTDPAGKITYTVHNEANHEVRVYAGWNTSTNTPTGPTQVTREDRAGSYSETLTMSATPSVSSGRPTGGESISSLQSLSRSYTNSAGQIIQSDDYFSFDSLTYSTSTTLGTENTHFYRTRYAYDHRGRQNMVQTPNGTITRTVYDGLDRPISKWVGTNDTGWTQTDPSGGGASGNNMVKVEDYQYDGGGVGDGNLTQTTQIPGGGATNRVSTSYFDWRNRPVASKAGVQSSEGTDTQRPITFAEYDNLSQIIVGEAYDGDNVTISDSNSDGVPDRPSSSLLRAKYTASFDELGRVYRTETFSVDPSNGSVSSNSLKSDTFFDKRGNAIKSTTPGGLVSKTVIDGAGRVTKSYTTDGGSDSGWGDADDVSGDIVLTQSENSYDASSNVILVTSRQRFHDETGTGELGTVSTGVKARVGYMGFYFDNANRLTADVDVGTNGGSAWTRPSGVPSRADTVLVTTLEYDAAGRLLYQTDPRGLIQARYYDARGLMTQSVEAYIVGPMYDPDQWNKTTEYTYDGSGNMTTLKVLLTGSAYQKTEWVYGVSSSTGSDIASNDVLYAVKHPDKSTGNPSSSEQETNKVNALDEIKEATDRNGNVHAFTRDVLGRVITDAVTTLGSGVDGSVRRVETAFNTQGMAYLFTSYDAASGGSVVNQVQREFNGLGQMIREYQAVSGSVNTSTTPKVEYAFSEMASGANHSRPTSMTYPNGKVVNFVYASGLNSDISRLSSITDTSGTLEEYDYLGLGTFVRRGHPQPDVDLTFIKQSGESDGDAGDKYIGLDRFGRVVDQRWMDVSAQVATDRFKYGYDPNGNRLYRENVVDATFSELYHANGASNGYDPTNQLTDFRRGPLSDTNSDSIPDTIATASRSQGWDHDNLGNFESQTTNGTSTSRTHNKQNQTTVVGSNNLAYDANGNLTTDEQGRTLVWDAWNRLVAVKSGSTTLVAHTFDALGRRVTDNAGTARALYYSADWQGVEERESGVVRVQTVFSPVYIDGIVLRDRDSDSNGTLDERLWVQQDSNFNVTALLDGSGAVVERMAYDPFGRVDFLTPSFGSRSASSYAWVNLHQGLRLDSVTGYYDNRARIYSPSVGRFLSVDPIGFFGGDVNLYRYIGNAAPNARDPHGLSGGSAIDIWIENLRRQLQGALPQKEIEDLLRRLRDGQDPTPEQAERLRQRNIRLFNAKTVGQRLVPVLRLCAKAGPAGVLIVAIVAVTIASDDAPVEGAEKLGKTEYELNGHRDSWKTKEGWIITRYTKKDGTTLISAHDPNGSCNDRKTFGPTSEICEVKFGDRGKEKKTPTR